MAPTFTHTIQYLTKGIGGHDHSQIVHKPQQVEACFKVLDRLDPDQHKLAMLITQTFRKFKYEKIELQPGEEPTLPKHREVTEEDFKYKIRMELDDVAIYELTKAFIKTNSVKTTQYDDTAINEIMADIGAMYKFGMWLLTEHIAPFFQNLHTT